MADEAARRRAIEVLVTPLLIEAGAGSGKTTLLVARILALVARGVPVHGIAAITFTRKAAGELRERVLARLDAELRGAPADGPVAWDRDDDTVRRRFAEALASLDRMFLGTIHGFCGRLLRERPVEAGLDPSFIELDEPAARADLRAFWADHLATLARADDPRLRALHEAGVELAQLESSFAARVAQGDATFASEPWPAPVATRAMVEGLLRCVHDATTFLRAHDLHPDCEGSGFDTWDRLMCVALELEQALAGELAEWRAHGERLRDEPRATTMAGARWTELVARVMQDDPRGDDRFKVKTWGKGSSTSPDAVAAKGIADAWRTCVGATIETFHREALAHVYGLVMPLLEEAHARFRAWRLDQGRLTFDDLLQCAARLLQEQPAARADLAERWPHLLVDEYQDTDPVQAAVVACLGAVPTPDVITDWRTVTLRGIATVDRATFASEAAAEAEALRRGVVVVVGDPKQGIYRFRRADIGTFVATRELIARQGEVLALVRNFRSVHAIGAWVNAAFDGGEGFPREATAGQAAFAPLVTVREDHHGAIRRLEVPVADARGGQGSTAAVEAPLLAAWVRGEIDSGRRSAGDFLLLSRKRRALATYAAELAKAGVPAMLDGGEDAALGAVQELALVFRSLADPADRLLTAAVLEGPCFACTPADLWAAHRAGLTRLSLADGVPDAVRALAAGDERIARVVGAFDTLAAWRAAAVRLAPDELAQRILDDRALLLHVAGEPLGDGEAGALLGAVELLRAASLDHRTTLDAAVDALDDLLASGGDVASLRRGRGGVVRIMTVHGAKGLEAPVVLLAQPVKDGVREPRTIVRREDGRVSGMLAVIPDRGRTTPVALHPDWAAALDEETAREAEEGVRLRYVAATRAKHELVFSIATKPNTAAKTKAEKEAAAAVTRPARVVVENQVWKHFDGVPTGVVPLVVPTVAPPADATVHTVPAPLARDAYAAAARPSWTYTTVTRAAGEALRERREGAETPAPDDTPGDATPERDVATTRPTGLRARDWGTLVHRALEEAVRGRRGEALARALGALVRDEGHVIADTTMPRPDVLAALEAIVARAMTRPEWHEIERATTRLPELHVRFTTVDAAGRPQHVDGVADLVLQVDGAWSVWDWKTSDGDESWWSAKLPEYEAQLGAYAAELSRRLGEPVAWRLVRLV
jgi:ATP-dependent helicase/nuclease subunit A